MSGQGSNSRNPSLYVEKSDYYPENRPYKKVELDETEYVYDAGAPQTAIVRTRKFGHTNPGFVPNHSLSTREEVLGYVSDVSKSKPALELRTKFEALVATTVNAACPENKVLALNATVSVGMATLLNIRKDALDVIREANNNGVAPVLTVEVDRPVNVRAIKAANAPVTARKSKNKGLVIPKNQMAAFKEWRDSQGQ